MMRTLKYSQIIDLKTLIRIEAKVGELPVIRTGPDRADTKAKYVPGYRIVG